MVIVLNALMDVSHALNTNALNAKQGFIGIKILVSNASQIALNAQMKVVALFAKLGIICKVLIVSNAKSMVWIATQALHFLVKMGFIWVKTTVSVVRETALFVLEVIVGLVKLGLNLMEIVNYVAKIAMNVLIITI